MNFSSMEYFAALARERNFTRAAEHLHITQQSLSTHIAGLEKELGCQLLIRHVPLELTYAGEVFLRYALSFQKKRTAMLQEFCDIAQNQKGVLRVGVALTRGRVILPEIIMEFQKAYPNITVELVEEANDALYQLLLNKEIDLAIAGFPTALHDIILQDFYREEVVLLISAELFQKTYGAGAALCRQQFQQGDFSLLKNCPFLLRNIHDITTRISLEVFKRADIGNPAVRARSSNLEMLLTLCVMGAGACFSPENLARSTLSEEQFASLEVFRLGDGAKYTLRFGYLAQSYQWSVIKAFIRLAEAGVRRTEFGLARRLGCPLPEQSKTGR